jgi:hypothetical protein
MGQSSQESAAFGKQLCDWLAALLEASARMQCGVARWLRNEPPPPPLDCDWCLTPETGAVVHYISLCSNCASEWEEMKRRLYGWRRK